MPTVVGALGAVSVPICYEGAVLVPESSDPTERGSPLSGVGVPAMCGAGSLKKLDWGGERLSGAM